MYYSYAYFVLHGDDFDPDEVTQRLKLTPTKKYRKGEKGEYIPITRHSHWSYSSEQKEGAIDIDELVLQAIEKFVGKEEEILSIKEEYNLSSTLEIVLWIDMNEETSTPYIGHDLKVIDFLHKTRTKTDVDIYRYNSNESVP